MKNVKCKQLIDRSFKALAKIGTFKDISFFGTFVFPLTGQYKGGIIPGKRCEQDQGTSLGSFVPNIANSWSYRCFRHRGRLETIRHNSGWTGCTKWVVLSEIHSGTPEDAVRRPPAEPSANDDLRPVPVFALNKGGAKVTKCTKEQKDIMIASYDRQKTSLIKANPADVIQAMRAAGVSELKESQMKSWWSCYHRK